MMQALVVFALLSLGNAAPFGNVWSDERPLTPNDQNPIVSDERPLTPTDQNPVVSGGLQLMPTGQNPVSFGLPAMPQKPYHRGDAYGEHGPIGQDPCDYGDAYSEHGPIEHKPYNHGNVYGENGAVRNNRKQMRRHRRSAGNQGNSINARPGYFIFTTKEFAFSFPIEAQPSVSPPNEVNDPNQEQFDGDQENKESFSKHNRLPRFDDQQEMNFQERNNGNQNEISPYYEHNGFGRNRKNWSGEENDEYDCDC